MLKLFGSKQPTWLSKYPKYSAPFTGKPAELTEIQAKENLQYLLDHKTERIASLSELVSKWEIDVKAGMDAADPQPLVNDLHNWSGEQWCNFYNKKKHTRSNWLESSRGGDEIIYSIIMDTAIVLGELIVTHQPRFSWGVDLDADNIRDGMPTVKRCVVQAEFSQDIKSNVIADVEWIAAARFLNPENIRQRLDNTWRWAVKDALSWEGFEDN